MAKEKSDVLSSIPTFTEVGANLYATYQNGKMRRDAARHNAAMARFQADLIDIQVGFDIEDLKTTESQFIGGARAAAGASGFATDEGSKADIVSSIRHNIALDAAAIRTKGELDKFGAQYKAAGFELQAGQESRAARLGMAQTLVSASSKAQDIFLKAATAGIGG